MNISQSFLISWCTGNTSNSIPVRQAKTSDLGDLGGWELAAAYPAFGYPYSS